MSRLGIGSGKNFSQNVFKKMCSEMQFGTLLGINRGDKNKTKISKCSS